MEMMDGVQTESGRQSGGWDLNHVIHYATFNEAGVVWHVVWCTV
jgi:hypothetical protein